MTEEELPAGEYAIVECLGHRTLDGIVHDGFPAASARGAI